MLKIPFNLLTHRHLKWFTREMGGALAARGN